MIRWPRSEFVSVFILGVPASGKTTLAARLVRSWKFFKRNRKPIAVYTRVESPRDVEYAIEFASATAREIGAKAVSLVFDDATYAFGQDKASRGILARLMRIRHEVQHVKHWQVVVISHWFRGVPPILRSADLKVLTSIDETWIEDLSKVFPPRALWDFLEEWSSYFEKTGKKAGLALFHFIGREPVIVRWRKTPEDMGWPWLDVSGSAAGAEGGDVVGED